jgi:hypothetical protein
VTKDIPIAVKAAREALEILKSEGAVENGLEKALPFYALQLAKTGATVTVETLLDVARQGAAHIKTLTTQNRPPVQQEDSLDAYLRIAKKFGGGGNADRNRLDRLNSYEHVKPRDMLDAACTAGDIDQVKLLISKGTKITAKNNYAVRLAASFGDIALVKLLISHGADIKALKHGALKWAVGNDQFGMVKFLVDECGSDVSFLDKEQKKKLDDYYKACTVWQRIHHMDPPYKLEENNPVYFKKSCFQVAVQMLGQEGYQLAEANKMAFQAAALFQSEQTILKYLEKWGTEGKQPLHDLIQMIKLPANGRPNLKDWGDAVLKCGPSMAKLLKFSDRLTSPMKSSDGKTWSMVNTRAECAKFAFNKAAENPALAALCMENFIHENSFNKALDIVKTNVPTVKNIPDISINGEKFDMAGGKFYRLAAHDVRGLFLGAMTDCCQSVGSVGAECATHGYTSKDSGFYVVENAKGKIVAQTWAWRGTHGEMCFDSLETLGGNVKSHQWVKILKETAAELTAQKDTDVTALHVGRGGGTQSNNLQTTFKKTASATPKDYTGYRDSKGTQILVWRRDQS